MSSFKARAGVSPTIARNNKQSQTVTNTAETLQHYNSTHALARSHTRAYKTQQRRYKNNKSYRATELLHHRRYKNKKQKQYSTQKNTKQKTKHENRTKTQTKQTQNTYTQNISNIRRGRTPHPPNKPDLHRPGLHLAVCVTLRGVFVVYFLCFGVREFCECFWFGFLIGLVFGVFVGVWLAER